MTTPFVRFAPSPTGRLHVGNLRTALINYLFAKQQGGGFMLRIDDTDYERSKPRFGASIRNDLEWMGIEWGTEAYQSTRIEHYHKALDELLKSGRAYKCFESQEELDLKRKAQRASGRPPVYDRAALKLTDAEIAAKEKAGEKPHYRFKLDDETVTWNDLVRGEVSVPMSSLSDPVILRADGRVIYTLASVVDDLDYRITHILRGEDHTTNSAAQIQLFKALGGTPPAMGHFSLLAGRYGEKLSKRFQTLSIGDLRYRFGYEPLALASQLSRIGTSDAVEARFSMDEVIKNFDISRFGRASPHFDFGELNMLNRRILGRMDFDMVKERLKYLDLDFDVDEDFWKAIRGNIDLLYEAGDWFNIINKPMTPSFNLPSDYDAMPKKQKAMIKEEIQKKEYVLDVATTCLPEEITQDTWGEWTKAIMAETELKGRDVFMTLRLALTDREDGPELKHVLPLMGRERILGRLKGKRA